MEQLSVTTHLLMIVSTVFVAAMLFKATRYSLATLLVSLVWVAAVSSLAWKGFYRDGMAMPPRMMFMVGPPVLIILFLFLTTKGRAFIDNINPADTTLLHVVRLPIEIMLHQLFLASLIPQLMTYEGWNFDIFSGVTAPLVFYFGYVKKKLSSNILLTWNFVCLVLLFIIVTVSILSAQTPFQKLAFEQPNVGVTYFPFAWLPAIVVPAVLFSHLVNIRHLLKKIRN